MFIPPHQLNGRALAGRQALSHWSRASLPSYKSGYKNHLQNQLRCRPYGCEFNKDKPHLLTAAGSLGFNASLSLPFSSLTPFPCMWALCPENSSRSAKPSDAFIIYICWWINSFSCHRLLKCCGAPNAPTATANSNSWSAVYFPLVFWSHVVLFEHRNCSFNFTMFCLIESPIGTQHFLQLISRLSTRKISVYSSTCADSSPSRGPLFFSARAQDCRPVISSEL